DMTRVRHVVAARKCGGGTGLFSLPDDLEGLKATLEAFPGCRLVIIDPISAFMSPDINEYREADVRRALDPLAKVAEEFRVAIVMIKHFNKDRRASASDRVAGGRAYVNCVRAYFAFGNVPDDPERFAMAAGKF